VVHLCKLHEKYGDRVSFLFVYIREAGHAFPVPVEDDAESPDSPEDTRSWMVKRVRAGIRHFGMRFPCLLDNEQAEVQKLYDAYPRRMLVLDPDGHIAVDSGNAPNLLFPWKAITDYLDRFDSAS
jgi:hypothetical protein